VVDRIVTLDHKIKQNNVTKLQIG